MKITRSWLVDLIKILDLKMALRNIYKVRPISDKARLQFAENMNNDPIAYIEDKRSDGRWFFSSKNNPDFWFWSDGADDPHWRYEEII